ncbi:MAG: transglutaminase domain-containing protein [Salinivirgaceae bacterium]|jgi:tetratricopeptide (TPR) repeat protein
MKKLYGFVLFLFLTLQISAQDFSLIDAHSKTVPSSESKTVESLAAYLNKPASTDLEKVRAYYVWIANNISYDTKTFFSGKSGVETSPLETLKKKKAICQGYSELFRALCQYSQIPCYLVDGYSKGYGYKPGKKFVQSDHAWNVVFVDNKWQLIDATWASGYMDESLHFKKFFTNEYFLTQPDDFVKKHLPSDPMWQLLAHTISMECYLKGDAEIAKCNSGIGTEFVFADSIRDYGKLSYEMQQVVSAERAYNFYPENVDATGYAYLNLAFVESNGLNELYDKKDYQQALIHCQKALELNEKAYSYLKRSKTPNGKSAVDICKQNISSLKESIRSLQNILK